MDREYVGSVLLEKGDLDNIVADVRGLLKLHTNYWWDSIEEVPLTVDHFLSWANPNSSLDKEKFRNYLPSFLAELTESSREDTISYIKRAWGERQIGVLIRAVRHNKLYNDDWIAIRIYDLIRIGGAQAKRWEIKAWAIQRDHVQDNANKVLEAIRQLQ